MRKEEKKGKTRIRERKRKTEGNKEYKFERQKKCEQREIESMTDKNSPGGHGLQSSRACLPV